MLRCRPDIATAALGDDLAMDSAASDRERAVYHAAEAERLLKSWWLSTHVKAQVHATLAVYYARRVAEA
jgi:hypothetical protein